MSGVPDPRSTWQRVEAGHYVKWVSLAGYYTARRGRDGRWSLHYDGGYSSHVGVFGSLRAVKEYVGTRGGAS